MNFPFTIGRSLAPESIRPISGQTVRTGALRGPIRPACSALTSANGIPLCPNPSHTQKVGSRFLRGAGELTSSTDG